MRNLRQLWSVELMGYMQGLPCIGHKDTLELHAFPECEKPFYLTGINPERFIGCFRSEDEAIGFVDRYNNRLWKIKETLTFIPGHDN